MPLKREVQRLNYHKKKQLGICVWYGCDIPVTVGCHCEEHRSTRAQYQRVMVGCRKWKPGGRGRPPITETTS